MSFQSFKLKLTQNALFYSSIHWLKSILYLMISLLMLFIRFPYYHTFPALLRVAGKKYLLIRTKTVLHFDI